MSQLLFEGLSAPAPLAGKVQMVLETEALDTFLHELLKAVQLIGKDMHAMQTSQTETSASVAKAVAEVEGLKKDVAALKEQKQSGLPGPGLPGPGPHGGLDGVKAELRQLKEQAQDDQLLGFEVKAQLQQLKQEMISSTGSIQELEAQQKKHKSSLSKLSDSVATLTEQLKAEVQRKTVSQLSGGIVKPSTSRIASATSTVLPDDLDSYASRADWLEINLQNVLERLPTFSTVDETTATRAQVEKLGARMPEIERQISQLKAAGPRQSSRSKTMLASQPGEGGDESAPSTQGSSSSTQLGGGGRYMEEVRGEVEELGGRVAGLEEESNAARAEVARLQAQLAELRSPPPHTPAAATARAQGWGETELKERVEGEVAKQAERVRSNLTRDLARDLEALRSELTRGGRGAFSGGGVGKGEVDKVRETIGGVMRRVSELAAEMGELRKATQEVSALKALAEQAVDKSAQHSADSAALSLLFKDFIATVDKQLQRLQHDVAANTAAEAERVSRPELQQMLEEIAAQWDEQLSGTVREMRDLRAKVGVLEERRRWLVDSVHARAAAVGARSRAVCVIAAALQRCLSCRHPVSDPRQVLYWSVQSALPRVEQQIALAPVTDGKVYRVTADHEVTLGTTLPPPSRAGLGLAEQHREEDAAVPETLHQHAAAGRPEVSVAEAAPSAAALPLSPLPRSSQTSAESLKSEAETSTPSRPRTPPASSFRRPHAQHPARKPLPHSCPLPVAPSS